MIIIVHELCPAVQRGWQLRTPKSVHLLSTQQILSSLPPLPYPRQYIYPPPPPQYNLLPPYLSQEQCNLTFFAHYSIFLQPLQFCSPHPPVPTDGSQIPHTSPLNAPHRLLHLSHTLHTLSTVGFLVVRSKRWTPLLSSNPRVRRVACVCG